MRLVRTIVGMLLLTMGVPTLFVGAGLWLTTQHRDAGGAFSGALQDVTTTGYAVLVPDVDALLRQDAPFVRHGGTRLRVTADTSAGPAFVGLAPASDVVRYLSGVGHTRIDGLDLATGPLPVRATRIAGAAAPDAAPVRQAFWVRGGTGSVDWAPADLRGQRLALVIMNPAGHPGLSLRATAEVRPGWIDPATWALLVLGTLLIGLGMGILAWPGRRREVVYVVDPSQVPELSARLGAPLNVGPGRARPASLAEAAPSDHHAAWPALAPPPALPALGWPPLPRDGMQSDVPTDPPRGAGTPESGDAAAPPAPSDGTGAADATGEPSAPVAASPSPTAVAGGGATADSGGVADAGCVADAAEPGQSSTIVAGVPTARVRRRKTAGGLPIPDSPPAEPVLKATRPPRSRPATRQNAAKATDDDAGHSPG